MDRVAFFIVLGGKLVGIEGKYPENKFFVEIKKWMILWERHFPFINYQKFCDKRRDLKTTTRKRAGLPEYFTGKTTTYKGGDIFNFRNFTKTEKKRFENEETK